MSRHGTPRGITPTGGGEGTAGESSPRSAGFITSRRGVER